MSERRELLDRKNPQISQRRQVELLAVARSSAAYQPVPVSEADRQVIRLVLAEDEEIHRAGPCDGWCWRCGWPNLDA